MTPKSNRQKIRIGIAAVFGVILFSYAFFRAHEVIFGVKVSVSGIVDGGSYASPVLALSGSALHATTLSINGMSVPIDIKGSFQDTIMLQSGYSVVTIIARDKFGKEDEKRMRVLYVPPNTSVLTRL